MAKAAAQKILARLQEGEDWVPVFRELNLAAPEADPLDGLIEFRRGEKASWIEEFAFTSDKGRISDVIQQGTTFYVMRAEGSHDERTVPFAEASPAIRGKLAELRARMAWLEVELSVLDESTLQPDSLRTRLRDTLRQARLKLLCDAGL